MKQPTPSHRLSFRSTTRGFSLIEVTIASVLATMVTASVIVTFTSTMKHFRAISNYALIHKEGRMAVDLFAQDFRKCRDLANVSPTSVTLVIPTGFDANGNVTGSRSVRYYKSGSNLIRHDLSTGHSRTLSSNVASISFVMYDRLGQATTLTTFGKGVQVDMMLSRAVIGTTQTEDFLSARLVARNKP